MTDVRRPVLEAEDLTCIFTTGGVIRPLKPNVAVDRVSLRLLQGETIAIVGESGSGKTTLSLMLLRLLDPTSGQVIIEGRPASKLSRRLLSSIVQPVFQDPYSALNPRQTVSRILELPLIVHKLPRREWHKRVLDALDTVGLAKHVAGSYPNQLSGGQRQRVAIARALMVRPKILICDEPTSALDVSVQAQILNLLSDLKSQFELSYILVTHNISIVEHIADRVCVMSSGRIVEEAPTQALLSQPRHPYTRELLSAVLTPDPSCYRNEYID